MKAKRPTSLFNSYCSNIAKQVACCHPLDRPIDTNELLPYSSDKKDWVLRNDWNSGSKIFQTCNKTCTNNKKKSLQKFSYLLNPIRQGTRNFTWYVYLASYACVLVVRHAILHNGISGPFRDELKKALIRRLIQFRKVFWVGLHSGELTSGIIFPLWKIQN